MGSRIRRRGFVSGLVGAGAAAAFPTSVLGQRRRTPVIGFLNSLSKSGWLDYLAAFHSGLRETGFIEGQNVKFVYRWAEGRYDQLPALAAELTQQHVDLIAATGGNPATLAAKAATSDIPVVFIVAGDPVKAGLVASLNRPGGNMTGVSIITTSLEAKRLEFLHELVPQADLIAVLLNPEFPEAEAELKVAQTAADKLGTRLLILKAVDESDLEAAFGTAVNARAKAFLIASDPNYYALRHRLISLAAQHSIPTIYFVRDFAVAGGLMSYGASLAETYRQMGGYSGRILKGDKPADLPVVQPTKFEFVLNLKTAKTLALAVPQTLQVAADEVIE